MWLWRLASLKFAEWARKKPREELVLQIISEDHLLAEFFVA